MATSPKNAKPAAKAAPESAADAPPKSKKLMIIIIAVAVLLVGGGGAATWLLLGRHAAPPAAAGAAAPAEVHEAAPEASKTPVYVMIEPFVVNLQQETGDQFLQVSITLQVLNQETAETIKVFMPQLRSRMLYSLSSKKASELLTTEGKKKLTAELLTQLNAPFVPNGKPLQINDVFYTSFVIQQQ